MTRTVWVHLESKQRILNFSQKRSSQDLQKRFLNLDLDQILKVILKNSLGNVWDLGFTFSSDDLFQLLTLKYFQYSTFSGGCSCNGYLHLNRGECGEASSSGCGNWSENLLCFCLHLSNLHLPNLSFFLPCLHPCQCSGATWTITTAAETLVRRATGLPIAGPARHAGARPRRRKVSKVRK